jgi:Ca2+/Na+ antiporter
MNKRYWKIILRFAKEWFTIPQIVITISLFFAFFMMLQIQYSEYLFLVTLLILITLEMRIIYKVRKQHKEKETKKDKIFLLESMIGDTKNGYTGFTFVNLFNIIHLTNFNFSALNVNWVLVISIVLTLLCILFYISNYIIPQKAEELLEETYPEYKIAKSL